MPRKNGNKVITSQAIKLSQALLQLVKFFDSENRQPIGFGKKKKTKKKKTLSEVRQGFEPKR